MRNKHIYNKLELIETITDNLGFAIRRAKESKNRMNHDMYVYLYTRSQREHEVEITQKAVLWWRRRLEREIDNLKNCNIYVD